MAFLLAAPPLLHQAAAPSPSQLLAGPSFLLTCLFWSSGFAPAVCSAGDVGAALLLAVLLLRFGAGPGILEGKSLHAQCK